MTTLSNNQLRAYLDRIGLPDPAPLIAAGLSDVLRAHRRAIAFENFDIPLGRGISLNPDTVFNKLVTCRRGGYCFEQNQLFSQALTALGCVARPLLARVWLGIEPPDVPPRTHTLLLVDLGGEPWIADAGFGDGFTPAMPLKEAAQTKSDQGVTHRLTRDARGWVLARKDSASDGNRGASDENRGASDGNRGWVDQYSFITRPVHAADLAQANHWTSTHGSARHASAVIAGRVVPDGRLGLYGRDFSRTVHGKKSARTLTSAQDMRDVLAADFGISLPTEDVAQLFDFNRP